MITIVNMQNIPSHNKEIRRMFKATDGYYLMGADYSTQEPKCMSMMCQDKDMIQAFKDGKDIYAEIASVSFNKPYEDCLEFQLDENGNKTDIVNPGGKERRSQSKSILLGALYSRGVPSIAEQLNCSTKKAQSIKDMVMKGFPAIPKFEEDSLHMAEEKGYVTTLWGTKRRLPIMTKADYEFEWAAGHSLSDDPLDFEDDMIEEVVDEVPQDIINKYCRQLSKAWGDKKFGIINEAKQNGIIITDNTKAKADATRQVVNSRIQGSAANMTKLAMIKIHNDERLKELGFRMLVPIHDEILAEAPIENAKECAERFAQLMSEAPGDKFSIPISTDVEISKCWYGESIKI